MIIQIVDGFASIFFDIVKEKDVIKENACFY